MNGAFTILKKELIDSIRDRRTLFTAVLMPVFLMPAILIGTLKFQEYQLKQTEQTPALVAIDNQDYAPTLVSFITSEDTIELKDATNYEEAIEAGDINAYLFVPEDFETAFQNERPSTVRVIVKTSNIDSSTALTKVMTALELFNAQVGATRLEARDVNPEILTPVVPQQVDIATAEERGGFFIGFLLPMFIVLFAIVGGMYIAIDVSAGEKERKTLEALLLTPASRLKIVMGKFLAVAATASTTIVLSLFSLYFAFKSFPPNFGSGNEFIINLTPASIGIMLGIGVILAIMFSGLLLSVAIFAKSYKEAQNYITPFYLVAVLPVAILGQLPGFKPATALFLVPGVNAVFVIKEVLLGTYDVTHILFTVGSLCVFAIIAIIVASKIYSKEGILFRD